MDARASICTDGKEFFRLYYLGASIPSYGGLSWLAVLTMKNYCPLIQIIAIGQMLICACFGRSHCLYTRKLIELITKSGPMDFRSLVCDG